LITKTAGRAIQISNKQ